MTDKDGLTHDEIKIACRNIGINLDCGGCASAFYTGYGGDPHDEQCTVPLIEDFFEAWAIRHKSTGAYLPHLNKGEKPSHTKPTIGAFPRLFTSLRSAQSALNRWLEGKWQIEPVYQNYFGEWEGGDLYPTPVANRRPDEMEIVKFKLVREMNQ